MAQHDFNVADGSGAVVRSDVNGAFEALATNSMGPSAPSPTWPLMWWGDTTAGKLKQRNSANTAWIDRGDLASAFLQASDIGESIAPSISVNEQTGTSYTPGLSDNGKLITLDNASAISLTIPQNSVVAFPVGATIAFQQFGAGLVTMGGTGVTFKSRNGLVSRGQNAMWAITKKATDIWSVAGDLSS